MSQLYLQCHKFHPDQQLHICTTKSPIIMQFKKQLLFKEMILPAMFIFSKELLYLLVCWDCLCISSSLICCSGACWCGRRSRRFYVFRVSNQTARSALSGAPANNVCNKYQPYQKICNPRNKPIRNSVTAPMARQH